MSLSFKNTYGSYLTDRERQAENVLEQAQKNPEKALEAQDILQTAEGTREAFRRTGISINQFRVLQGGEQGHLVTMGAFERKPTSSGSIGLGNIETLQKGSSSVNEVADTVEGTIKHELRHQHSHKEALKRGESGMIIAYFGDDIDHDLQETMARASTTEGKDAYDAEQSRVNQLASSLQTSRQRLVDLLYKGEEKRVVEMGYESGYLEQAA